MSSSYKQDEHWLRKLIEDHLKPITGTDVKLVVLYKNKTYVNLFIWNNTHHTSAELRSHAVYIFCQADDNALLAPTENTLQYMAPMLGKKSLKINVEKSYNTVFKHRR